jgi:hypothetical protein
MQFGSQSTEARGYSSVRPFACMGESWIPCASEVANADDPSALSYRETIQFEGGELWHVRQSLSNRVI